MYGKMFPRRYGDMRDLWQHFDHKYQEVAINEVGIQLFEPDEGFQYVAYQNFILHYVEKGRGTYEVDGKKYHLKAGDGFIIRKGISVKYTADKKYPWKNYWVGLSGHYLTHHLDNTKLLQNVVLTFEEGAESVKILKAICDETLAAQPNRLSDTWYLGQVYQLLHHLTQEFTLSVEDDLNQPDETQDYAKIAFDYIYNNYMYPITIQEIADYIGINRSYLYRTFKEAYDMSPHQFLLDYRMDQARKALQQTKNPIYLIAESVGYMDQLQFSKAFKNRYQLSPTKFREKYKDIDYEEE